MRHQEHEFGCGCDCGCDRREFLAATSAALGGLIFTSLLAEAAESGTPPPAKKPPAVVRAVFLYPPSKTFADNPDGWWSWPGNDFDAEGRQRQYTAALRDMEKKLGMQLMIDDRPVADSAQAQAVANELEAKRPDGVLLVIFYNYSLAQDGEDAEVLAAESGRILGRGLDAIPSRSELLRRVESHSFETVALQRAVMESRVAYCYEVDGACPCGETICRLP